MLVKVGFKLHCFLPEFNLTSTQNMVQGELVNGSVGQVVKFSTSQEAMQNKTEIATEEGLRGSEHDTRQAAARYDGFIWPVVRFTNGRELLCVPTDFTVDNAYGEMEAKRRQVRCALILS